VGIRTVRCLVQNNEIGFKYICDDGEEFFDIDEATEHENKINRLREEDPSKYEQVWTIQQAINMAVAENRVVRFLWEESNEQIRRGIVDKKDCKILKPDRDSYDVAVVPPDLRKAYQAYPPARQELLLLT